MNTIRTQLSHILENFNELIELIPIIQDAASKGIERDMKAHIHDEKRLQIERQFLRESLSFLHKKWVIDLLYILQFLGEPHFNEIKRALPEINSKTLTDRLRFFENLNVIERTVQTERPIRVTYKLTTYGEGMIKILLPFIYYIILPRKYLKNLEK